MEIEKNIPIGSTENSSKTAIIDNLIKKMDIGDSFLIECESAIQSAYWRSALDYCVKKSNISYKFKLKKWNETHYRIWRTK